jgi:hypothetical protein
MTTIIRGARVLTLDVADTEHAKADIVTNGATITAVGPAVPTHWRAMYQRAAATDVGFMRWVGNAQ